MTFTDVNGQVSFRAGLEQSDPVPKDSVIEIESRITAHEAYLTQALASNDSLGILYAYLYRISDCLKQHDYARATSFLLKAEKLVNQEKHYERRGAVAYTRGFIFLRMDRRQEALDAYSLAADYCENAGDSLCLGESLEQMASLYSYFDEFDKAQELFDQAIKLLEKFGSERHLASAYNNFGSMLMMQGQVEEGIPYIKRSIEENLIRKHYRMAYKGMNNLASAYRRINRTDNAIHLFEKCIVLNREKNYSENMVNNYLGLFFAHRSQGNYKAALEAVEQHEMLKDSLIGVETAKKIAAVESKFNIAEKELELKRKEYELLESRHKSQRLATLIALIVMLGGVLFWRWSIYREKIKFQMAENRRNLNQITRVLLQKNAMIKHLEEKIWSSTETAEYQLSEDIYNQKILTGEDWESFKSYFEKSYPGFIFRLRQSHPSLTEAEERLFILIKLKLTSTEISTMLGISVSGVKKTRYRLRKRLELEEEVNLNDYIYRF
jgi:tetratricopeptide (TPR) repeat protein